MRTVKAILNTAELDQEHQCPVSAVSITERSFLFSLFLYYFSSKKNEANNKWDIEIMNKY